MSTCRKCKIEKRLGKPGAFVLKKGITCKLILLPYTIFTMEENTNEIKYDMDENIDDSVVTEETAVQTVKVLKEKLKKALAERSEYLNGWQRAKADLLNARKRDEEEKKEYIKFANERMIEDLLPVLQSFDMAMGNKEAWEKADKNWRIGVEYIYSQLTKALADNGLEEIKALGESFDHSLHDASSYEVVTDKNMDNKVIAVINKGYKLNGKILVPAKVKVGEFKG